MKQNSYDYNYSNFGYSVLGLVLENVYNTDYTTLLNEFANLSPNYRIPATVLGTKLLAGMSN